MALLTDLRHLFTRRKKPVKVDLTGTQAERLARAMRESEDSAQPDFGPDGDGEREASAVEIETFSLKTARPQQAPLNRPPDYEEVMTLVRRISDHLDSQNRRTARLVEVIDRLPHALDSLPEITRQNARLLEILSEHLEHARSRGNALDTVLSRITEASSHQTEVLSKISQQLDANRTATNQVADTLGSTRQTLADLGQSNTRSTQVMADLVRSQEQRESRYARTVERNQRFMIATIAACGITALAAVVVAVFALLQ